MGDDDSTLHKSRTSLRRKGLPGESTTVAGAANAAAGRTQVTFGDLGDVMMSRAGGADMNKSFESVGGSRVGGL